MIMRRKVIAPYKPNAHTLRLNYVCPRFFLSNKITND